MTLKNIIPLFIILSLSSTFSYSNSIVPKTETLEQSTIKPFHFCKDYPFCKEETKPKEEKK